MQAVVLLAGFVLLAMAGCFAAYRLGRFLDSVQQARADMPETIRLRVAVSDFCMAQSVMAVLKGMRSQHPDIQCTFSVGGIPEVLQWLDAGDADVIVVPADTQEDENKPMLFASQRLGMGDGYMVCETADGNRSPQKVLWKKEGCPAGAAEFIKRLCRQER